ncbi:hypothetical protein PRIPAC_88218, partial [Pristionchus pacificus]|uniref:Peptidase n=1 Tax=Pristionchus pacificus TaxID=54126 RepID=A0A2A6B871_PRIPA
PSPSSGKLHIFYKAHIAFQRNLPGAPPEPAVFPMYSGYIDVEMDGLQHKVYYVLCEAIRAYPLEAPLVVWLNGGPGASSLLGLLLEHGPYILETDGSLRYNDFSWNQYSNVVLYIESPSFVGFSHVSNHSRYRNAKKLARCATLYNSDSILTPDNVYQDEATATLNTDALHVFMTKVHPRYADRDFFMTGESNGGLYAPFLAREVLAGIKKGTFTNDRLKVTFLANGIAMGNAGMDIYTRMFSAVLQTFSMGMVSQKISERLFEFWQITRDGNPGDWVVNDIWTWMGDFRYLLKSTNGTGATYLYNLHLDCEDNDNNEDWHIEKKVQHAECTFKAVPERYLNREDVQKALHVISEGNTPLKWIAINHDVTLSYYQAFEIFHIYEGIVDSAKDDFRILYFSGDP